LSSRSMWHCLLYCTKVDQTLMCDQMKSNEQYIHVVLSIQE